MATVRLRNVQHDDLDTFFEHQLDPQARHMAAFTSADPADRGAFDRHWQRIMSTETVTIRTALVDEEVAGYVLSYLDVGRPEVGYWFGRDFWGRGVASRALELFLNTMQTRPVFARAARDNLGSIRVLQKCGFVVYGTDHGFANARGEDTPELLLRLD